MSGRPNRTGVIYVTLREYLVRLETLERLKPKEQRREVPSMAELARAVGVNPASISRWVMGERHATTHNLAGAIIFELRARGFGTELGDVLAYREIDAEE